MKFIPILFSTEMVQAILAGRKTQTRRTRGLKVNEQPSLWKFQDTAIAPYTEDPIFYFKCDEYEKHVLINSPFGKPGDVLWVRETFSNGCVENGKHTGFRYKADDENHNVIWKPSLFMTKNACRIFLKIKDVRVERLQNIDKLSAINEGVEIIHYAETSIPIYRKYNLEEKLGTTNPILSFYSLWEKINGEDSVDQNPWVWVIEFERIEKPDNFLS